MIEWVAAAFWGFIGGLIVFLCLLAGAKTYQYTITRRKARRTQKGGFISTERIK
jgi:hypothetical protein